MTYDLLVLPVDGALTFEEALAAVEVDRDRASDAATDIRLEPFVAAMERRFWRLRGLGPIPPPFEFDVDGGHVVIGIPWSRVAEVTRAVGEAAYRSGVAVIDLQREIVALPSPYADEPMQVAGTEPHVASARDVLAAIRRAADGAAASDLAASRHAAGRSAGGDRAAAAQMMHGRRDSGITPDGAAETLADPARVPASLQTPELRTELIEALGAAKVGERHRALGRLAGWDPDPVVAGALRPILASEDVFIAGVAATGLARQADLTDLPAVLDLVRRLSPADGGTTEAMLFPLRAALALATIGGPMVVEGVKARAREWRGAPKVRHQSWERVFDEELDGLLSPG